MQLKIIVGAFSIVASLSFSILSFAASSDSATSSTSTNAASSTPPAKTSELAFGNVTVDKQPTAEVTMLGYTLASHAAYNIARRVNYEFSLRDRGASMQSNATASGGTASAADSASVVDPKQMNSARKCSAQLTSSTNQVADEPRVLITNQKRSVLLTVQYDLILSKLQYTIDSSNVLVSQFEIIGKLLNPGQVTLLDTGDKPNEELNIYNAIAKELSDNHYDPSILLGSITPPPIPKGLAGSATSLLAGGITPGIGQAQAAVDALTGLGQSVAKFVSLFRSNQEINGGVTINIPNEALNNLVIAYLRKYKIHCYDTDDLPDDTDSANEIDGVQQSKVLQRFDQLGAIGGLISSDISRIDTTGGAIAPSIGDQNQPDFTLSNNRIMLLLGLKAVADQLIANDTKAKAPAVGAGAPAGGAAAGGVAAAPASPSDKVHAAYGTLLGALKTSMQNYEDSVTKLIATLNGDTSSQSPNSSPQTGNKNNPGGDQVSSTNAAPIVNITNSPTISPQITVGAEPSTNSAPMTDGAPSSTGATSKTDSTSTPLATILHQEALFEKLQHYPMLYLNVLSASGANMTSNGWWNSDEYFNAGVIVDYSLVNTDGEIIIADVEGRQSPYVKATGHSDDERLPTVLTTSPCTSVKSDLDDLDDMEPESRFSETNVHRVSVDDAQQLPETKCSVQNLKHD